MAIYDVTAGSFTKTGELVGEIRTERIDTDNNELFHGCDGPWDVEDRYEAFWNRLNGSWEHDFPFEYKQRVKVFSVLPVR